MLRRNSQSPHSSGAPGARRRSVMDLPTRAADGHAFTTRWCAAATPKAALLFLPALGVPANRYAKFAQALADRGVAVAVPEWRGTDTSSLRPSRRCDWGYPELV